jgi:predicted nucleotidyltransferase
MNFGLEDSQYHLLNEIIIQPLVKKGATIWIFGSRARGDQKPFSDVDLLFEMPDNKSLNTGFLFEIKSQLEDSNFKYKLDLVNITELAESYKPSVFADRVLIHKA